MKKPFRGVAAFLCALVLCCFAPLGSEAALETQNPYHILYLSSYSYSWGTVPLQIEGVDRAFDGLEYVVNYEFMDTKNTEYSAGYKEFYDLLKYKMETRYPYDGVVVADDAALNFAMQYRDELFSGVPLTFLAVDNVQAGEAAAADPLITGLVEQVNYQKNIEIAHKLCPKANCITFILDNKENGQGIAKQLEAEQSLFENYRVEYLNSSEYTREELCQRLASFTDEDMVFFVAMGQQANGIILTENERYQMAREYASVPLFRLTNAGVGDGPVGGYVVDFEQSGYIAGQMIRQMLEDPAAGCPAMRYDTPGMYYFDYAAMKDHGLNPALLPEGTTVINRPESFWRTYSNQIIIGMLLALLAGTAFFIVALHRGSRELAQKNRELMVASNAKTDFLSHMSHDMRTPMNGILGITNLLKDRTDPAEIRADVEQIERSGRYLLNLINDTLDMSRIESGRLELHPIPVNSEQMFQNIISTTQILADQKGVRLALELPPIAPGQWVSVVTDEARVSQVFMNLISNAVKFTPEGGTVTLHMETVAIEENSVRDRYIISDTGIGMSEEFQKHLFEPFSQEGRTNTNYESGTGLGLAIVRQVVDLLGGTIAVESKLGEGTKITMELTYPRSEEDVKPVLPRQADLSGLNGRRVLLCEDHPVNAQIAIRLLQKQGVQVDHAENGKLGVERLSQSPEHYYDAVLMDIQMPVMNGLEAAKAIRALPGREDVKTLPILAMTANAFDSDVRHCLDAGMNAHIAKPIEPRNLYKTLASYLAAS